MKDNNSKIKSYILKNKNTLLGVLTFALLAGIAIYVSYAFVEVEHVQSLVGGKLGNINDVEIIYMIEGRNATGEGTGTYVESKKAPILSYQYDNVQSNCINGSNLDYDEASDYLNIESNDYDKCYIYYKAKKLDDIIINTYIQDQDELGVLLTTYTQVKNIPNKNYTMNTTKSVCKNNSEVSYDTNTRLFTISALQKDECDLYLDIVEDKLKLNINVQTKVGSTTYKKVFEIPENVFYTLNSNSSCANNSVITFENQKITVNSTNNTTCNINLDIANGPIIESLNTSVTGSDLIASWEYSSVGTSPVKYYYSTNGTTWSNTTEKSITIPVDSYFSLYAEDANGLKSKITEVGNNSYFYNKYIKFDSNVRNVTVPKNGYYKVELWGASGGTPNASVEGGKGAYVTGILNLNTTDTLYVYTGGEGKSSNTTALAGGGYNGGGSSSLSGGAGGGATDIRINNDSLLARVMVAGAGGGAAYYNNDNKAFGGAAGGIKGMSGTSATYSYKEYTGLGGTQKEGGVPGIGTTVALQGEGGQFGIGGSTKIVPNASQISAGAGGAGWYGGASAGQHDKINYNSLAGGGGGSSYVYNATTAVNYPTGCLLNANNYVKKSQVYGGYMSFYSPFGYKETGHTGDGYVIISYIGSNL